MKVTRNESRIYAIETLYQIEMFDKNINKSIEDTLSLNEIPFDNETLDFFKELVKESCTHRNLIYSTLDKNITNNWKITRFNKVDLALLTVATYELLYTQTPKAVIINEYVELSKRFSDKEFVSTINGILDKVNE